MIGWASMHRFLVADYDDYTIDLRAKWDIGTIPAVKDCLQNPNTSIGK